MSNGRSQILSGLPPLRGMLPLVLLLALWQVFGPERSAYFPRPDTWWSALAVMTRAGRLAPALSATLVTFGISLAVACALGAVLGLLLGRVTAARRALDPLLEFCRGLPPPVIVPVAVLLLGYAQGLKLLVVVWVAIWPILLNVAAAAGAVEPVLLEVARTFHLSRGATLAKVVAPAVLPAFLLGVRIALPLSIIVTLLVEMVTMLPGVGSLIVSAQREYRSADVYGLLVLIGVIGFCLNNFFIVIEAAILRCFPPPADKSR